MRSIYFREYFPGRACASGFKNSLSRILALLLQRPGEIVTREELQQLLWPEGTHVNFDGSLNAALKKLRAAIQDDAENPRFIETVPRQGLSFPHAGPFRQRFCELHFSLDKRFSSEF